MNGSSLNTGVGWRWHWRTARRRLLSADYGCVSCASACHCFFGAITTYLIEPLHVGSMKHDTHAPPPSPIPVRVLAATAHTQGWLAGWMAGWLAGCLNGAEGTVSRLDCASWWQAQSPACPVVCLLQYNKLFVPHPAGCRMPCSIGDGGAGISYHSFLPSSRYARRSTHGLFASLSPAQPSPAHSSPLQPSPGQAKLSLLRRRPKRGCLCFLPTGQPAT
jgi:hypothetical protein